MAITRCPARYKNVGLETFGNKKKVTEEFLKQCCKNDEWLRLNIEELRYLTPPAVRKTFNLGDTLDWDKSWGCDVNGDGRVQFSNKTVDSITIDLKTEEGLNKWYDNVKSSTTVDKSNNGEHKIITLPHTDVVIQEEEIGKFGSAEDVASGYNSAWYVGFDKSKNFYLKPKWVEDWKKYVTSSDIENDCIPAIARAQTFKVPTTMKGKNDEEVTLRDGDEVPLVKIDIPLEYNGTPTASSSPLYVQIWDTYEGWANVTEWDKKTKTVIPKYRKREEHKTLFGSYPPSTWKRYKKITTQIKYKKGKKKGQVKETIVTFKKDNNGDYVKKRKKIYRPKPNGGKSIQSPLAEYIYNPQESNKNGEATIVFENAPKLKVGGHYAIVLLSPLNNWDNCPRWGGWGRNCNVKKNYEHGNAFYSSNNGRSWKRYGKNGVDEDIEVYQQGKYVPRDYRFRCHVRIQDENTQIEYQTDREIYLNPIYHNPIHSFTLHSTDFGTESNETDLSIQYQVSTDGDNWYDIQKSVEFDVEKEIGKASRVIFLKAILKTSNPIKNPYVEDITINLNMYPPTEMYARSKPYTPDKFGTILGANLWGRVYAPYTIEEHESTDCKVDIIEMKENQEFFEIIDLDLLPEKVQERSIPNMGWINNYDTVDGICDYLTRNFGIVKALKRYGIYILPHEMSNGMHNLSFAPSDDKKVVAPIADTEIDVSDVLMSNDSTYLDNLTIENDMIVFDDNTLIPTSITIPVYPDEIGGIKLKNEVAYPVINCHLEPEDSEGHGKLSAFGEWYDYTFDYQENELIFKRDTLNRMDGGNLTVTYNPVFVKDLTNDEVGTHYDENGDVIDGLVLDYFKEKIEITETELSTNRIPLRVEALDPIRQVNLYTTDEEEHITLKENHDYYYDIDTRELVFGSNGMVNPLNSGDVLEIVYTPNLDDTSLCVGYNATRTNTNEQCYIDDYFIEYKV